MNGFLPPSLASAGLESAQQALDWRGTGCVLVVDDEDPVRIVVAKAVTRLGFTSASASNGREALAQFEADPALFTLAILDVKMAGMGGLEVMDRLRVRRPDLPVILMSGYNRCDVPREPGPFAKTGFLHKPFRLEALAAEIRAVVGD
jgi:two-component system, cell cycle sensor histidine kinase and response regulator CckA